jgi:hypothetical protein
MEINFCRVTFYIKYVEKMYVNNREIIRKKLWLNSMLL